MDYNEQKQNVTILAGVHRGMRDTLRIQLKNQYMSLAIGKTAGGIVVGGK